MPCTGRSEDQSAAPEPRSDSRMNFWHGWKFWSAYAGSRTVEAEPRVNSPSLVPFFPFSLRLHKATNTASENTTATRPRTENMETRSVELWQQDVHVFWAFWESIRTGASMSWRFSTHRFAQLIKAGRVWTLRSCWCVKCPSVEDLNTSVERSSLTSSVLKFIADRLHLQTGHCTGDFMIDPSIKFVVSHYSTIKAQRHPLWMSPPITAGSDHTAESSVQQTVSCRSESTAAPWRTKTRADKCFKLENSPTIPLACNSIFFFFFPYQRNKRVTFSD